MRAIAGAIILGIFCITPARAQRAIPDNNLAYPVLVSAGNSSGSGFFINTSTATYLITARHVLFNAKTGTLWASVVTFTAYDPDPHDTNATVFSVDLSISQSTGNLLSAPTKDVVAVKIGTSAAVTDKGKLGKLEFVPGVQMLQQSSHGIVVVPSTSIKKFDDVLIGNDIYIFGYPISLGLKEIPQIDLTHPLLRKGAIAGKNLMQRTIILDCASYPGNSGGPVLEEENNGFNKNFNIVGVVTQFVPFADRAVYSVIIENSGYSIAEPMDAVLDLVK